MPEFEVCVKVAEREVTRVTVVDGELVVVGRKGGRIALDPGEVRGVPADLGARERRVEVESEYVSRKHCLLWVESGELRVRDLHSVHGTYVGVPGGATVTTTSGPVELVLVSAVHAGTPSPEPVDFARVRSEEDYVRALVRSAREWARVTGVQLDIHTETREGPIGRTEEVSRLRVGDRHALRVTRGHHTARVSFEKAREVLSRYVVTQNALYEAVARGVRRGARVEPVLASKAMQDLCWDLARCALGDLRVILLGETGVGKSRMARRYHEATGRRGEFITIDCTQYDDRTRLRAEMFGAEPDAWPGLRRRYLGAFERARGGTVFIDEVGDLAPENQGQLLTFLDEGCFSRILGTDVLESDARVVCGTRQDLGRAVHEGRFREDLWYRLAGMVITIPPLRERPEDVEALLGERTVARTDGGEERSVREALTDDALEFLKRYAWPGNARELDTFCRRLPVKLGERERADAALCEEVLRAGAPVARETASASSQPPTRVSSRPPESVVEGDSGPWRAPVQFEKGRPVERERVSWEGVIEGALRDYALARGMKGDGDPGLGALFTVKSAKGEDDRGAFLDFVEKYVKPRIVARAMGLEARRELPASFVAEQWKRALGFGDGKSIRDLTGAYFTLQRRQALWGVLRRRGVELDAGLAAKIAGEANVDQLDRWIAEAERGEWP